MSQNYEFLPKPPKTMSFSEFEDQVSSYITELRTIGEADNENVESYLLSIYKNLLEISELKDYTDSVNDVISQGVPVKHGDSHKNSGSDPITASELGAVALGEGVALSSFTDKLGNIITFSSDDTLNLSGSWDGKSDVTLSSSDIKADFLKNNVKFVLGGEVTGEVSTNFSSDIEIKTFAPSLITSESSSFYQNSYTSDGSFTTTRSGVYLFQLVGGGGAGGGSRGQGGNAGGTSTLSISINGVIISSLTSYGGAGGGAGGYETNAYCNLGSGGAAGQAKLLMVALPKGAVISFTIGAGGARTTSEVAAVSSTYSVAGVVGENIKKPPRPAQGAYNVDSHQFVNSSSYNTGAIGGQGAQSQDWNGRYGGGGGGAGTSNIEAGCVNPGGVSGSNAGSPGTTGTSSNTSTNRYGGAGASGCLNYVIVGEL